LAHAWEKFGGFLKTKIWLHWLRVIWSGKIIYSNCFFHLSLQMSAHPHIRPTKKIQLKVKCIYREDATQSLPERHPDDKTLYLYSNLPGFDKFNLATWKARNPNIKPTRFNVESHELGLDEKNDDDGSALFWGCSSDATNKSLIMKVLHFKMVGNLFGEFASPKTVDIHFSNTLQ